MKPYYNDPYTTEFDAAAIESFQREDKTFVILDKTFFYPTSGGQEHDTGFIGDTQVTDVFEEDGRVLHVVSAAVPAGKVACRIDRERRLGNMQQHTGQHILSAAFENLFGIETVSSRLGEFTGTIDLSRMPSDKEVEESVATANRVVREDRKVTIHYAERDDIARFNLRKPPKVDGTVRIVDVEDFDMSPCGGTHCTHTSEVGVILTGNLEKVKGSLTRIEFFCGDRAVRRFNEMQRSALEISRIVSASMDELPPAVQKLKSQVQDKEAIIKSLREKVLLDICDKTLPVVENGTNAVMSLDLSTLVQSTEELRFVASCVSGRTKRSFAFHRLEGNICFMNLNLMTDEKKASGIVGKLRTEFGVKGGGRNGFYSVTFESARMADVIGFVRRSLANE